MARTEEELRREMAKAFKQKQVTILAKVKSVDQSKRTCDIDDDGVIVYGVRLQPITQGNTGITIYPKVDSQVLCVQVEGSDDYMVVHASEAEKVEIKIDDKGLVINKDGAVFNDGTIGSVKADAMVQWMSSVYQDLQLIKATLTGGVTTPAGAGSMTVPYTGGQTPEPQLSDFADDALKH